VLNGEFEIECADGVASAGPGTVLFAEDMTGEAHIMRLRDNVQLASFGVELPSACALPREASTHRVVGRDVFARHPE
jgi:hypothetical protein